MKKNRIMRPSTKIFGIVFAALLVIMSSIMVFFAGFEAAFFLSILFLIPAAITVWFILSVSLYVGAKKRKDEDLPSLKLRFIVASVLLALMVVLTTLLIGLFAMAIMFM